MPGFGIPTYRGRTSGNAYRLPLNVFRRGDHYIFVLTYGSDSPRVKNVLAVGECELRVGGRNVHLVEPDLIVVGARRLMPAPVRLMASVARFTQVLRMRAA
jgi:hypothetical protein